MTATTTLPLPIELLSDILRRLPAKSLVRFRSVSNEWSSLCFDPYLEKLRHQNHQDWKLIARDGLLYSLDLGSLDCAIRADHILQNSNFTVKKIWGCSNGKLCLSVSDNANPVAARISHFSDYVRNIPPVIVPDDIIVICDLSTGTRHIVPSSPIDFQVESLDDVPLRAMPAEWRRRFELDDPSEGVIYQEDYDVRMPAEMWRHFSYGFGLEKLVRISQYIFIGAYSTGCKNSLLSEAKVYSTKTDSWSRVDQDISGFYINDETAPVLASGVLYWIAGAFFMATEFLNCRDLVVGFDLGEESFSVVGHDKEGKFHFMCLGSLGGKLCALGSVSGTVTLLKALDRGDGSGDVLIPCASFDSKPWFYGSFEFGYSEAMTFSKNGDKVLVDNDEFMCWDFGEGTAGMWEVKLVSMSKEEKERLRREKVLRVLLRKGLRYWNELVA